MKKMALLGTLHVTYGVGNSLAGVRTVPDILAQDHGIQSTCVAFTQKSTIAASVSRSKEPDYLADAGTLTWDTIPTTWDAWADWAGPSASPISYTHTAVDVGATLTLRLREGRVASGTVAELLARTMSSVPA